MSPRVRSGHTGMTDFLSDGVELFAEICVSDYAGARDWYERVLGGPPSFMVHDTEGVWELAPHRWLVVVERPEHAGHSVLTVFVDDLGARVSGIAVRGVEAAHRETYDQGACKVIYRDPDGNEIGFGGNR